jgi:hypothetical protein
MPSAVVVGDAVGRASQRRPTRSLATPAPADAPTPLSAPALFEGNTDDGFSRSPTPAARPIGPPTHRTAQAGFRCLCWWRSVELGVPLAGDDGTGPGAALEAFADRFEVLPDAEGTAWLADSAPADRQVAEELHDPWA